MISFDTNLLLYSLNKDCPECNRARAFFDSLPAAPDEVVICELVLIELYVLLRNPVVLKQPLDAADAVPAPSPRLAAASPPATSRTVASPVRLWDVLMDSPVSRVFAAWDTAANGSHEGAPSRLEHSWSRSWSRVTAGCGSIPASQRPFGRRPWSPWPMLAETG